MEIKRGDIWYVRKDNYTGCEQAAGRPAIIVSNEKNNACAETVEVVSTFAASSSSAASWMTTTPAICVMRSATGWSRSWSRSSPAGSTV